MSEQDQRAFYAVRDAAQSLNTQLDFLAESVGRLIQTMGELSYEITRLNEHNERRELLKGSQS